MHQSLSHTIHHCIVLLACIRLLSPKQKKIDFCKSLGADDGWNYHEMDWSKGVEKATKGKGVDIIVDYIGAGYFSQNLSAAARDAHIVMLAFLGGTKLPEGVDISPFLAKRLRFEGSSLRSRDAEYQGKLRDKLVEEALPKIVDGTFQVPIERVFDWGEIQDAHALMESNKTQGKIICKVS
jgi:NADPH:quinone reductase-like Zn-dependent oxidoreductase